MRLFVSPLALASSCVCLTAAAAAASPSDLFDALAAPLCLREEAPPLQPNRRALSWPDDAVAVTAAAVAAAASTAALLVRDESWLPVGFAAVVVTAHDETTLQKILSFISSSVSNDLHELGARYFAGTCSGSQQPDSIKTGQQFMIFENSFAFDDDFGTLDAVGALLQLSRQRASHWHEPVYNNSLCVLNCDLAFCC